MAGSRSDRQGRRAAPPPIIDLKAEEVVDAKPETAAQENPAAPSEPDSAPDPAAETPEPAPAVAASEEALGETGPPPESDAPPPPTDNPPAPEEPDEPSRWPGMLAYAAAAAILLVSGGLLVHAFGDRLWPSGPDPDVLALTARLDQTTASVGSASDRLTAVERDLSALRDAHTKLAADTDNLRKAFEEQTAAARKSIDAGDSRIAEVERRQAEMQGTIESLRSSLANSGDSGAAALVTGELKTSFDALTARLEATEKRLADTTAELEAMKQAQDQAATERGRADTGAAALGEAVTALAGKVRQGQPFAPELEALAGLEPAAPGLDVLRLHAAAGIPSAPVLATRLSDLLPSLTDGAEAGTDGNAADAGLWSRFKARMASLVKVRRLDAADWPATVEKARDALATGDVDAAIRIVEAASTTPPQPIADWLSQARASRDVEAALRQVETAALARLGNQP